MNRALIWQHLFIVMATSFLSVLIGIPLGICSYVFPKSKRMILEIVDILQTIPCLAMLGVIMFFAGAGKKTVIIGITLYSLLPIARNTCLGFENVDSGIKEAANGMGMTRLYQLLWVEFPLAFPIILTGIRIAIANAIGTAVFAAFVGGGGLGGIITQGIRTQNMGKILLGTGALMVIAVVIDAGLGLIEKQAKKYKGRTKKMFLPLVFFLLAFILLIPFGTERIGNNELMLYDGDYSETQIMHHIVKQLVEDRTDLTVTIQDQMSQVNNFNALIGDHHTCDLMISYDGTLLTTFLHKDPADVPDGESIFDYANSLAEEKHGIYLLGKIGFDNTYSIAVPQHIADRYDLNCISDLVPVADLLTFGAEHEFFTQEGSMKYDPFREFYNLQFADSVSVDVSLKYTAIERGNFDVTEVYATDGLNRKAGLKVLEDDRNFFPEYNGALLVRSDLFQRFADTAPELREVLSLLDGTIANEDMVNMTYQVDVEGRGVDEVAREFLFAKGLLLN